MLPVTLHQPQPDRHLRGQRDLATGTADPSPVKLSVDATDGAGWAIAAVVLGFLAGIAYTLWTGRWVPRRCSRSARGRSSRPTRTRSDGSTKPSRTTLAYHDYAPDLDAIASYQAGVEAAISTWAGHTIVADHDAAEYKAILKLLQTAEDDATLFGEQLAGSLNGGRGGEHEDHGRPAAAAQADGRATGGRAAEGRRGDAGRDPGRRVRGVRAARGSRTRPRSSGWTCGAS